MSIVFLCNFIDAESEIPKILQSIITLNKNSDYSTFDKRALASAELSGCFIFDISRKASIIGSKNTQDRYIASCFSTQRVSESVISLSAEISGKIVLTCNLRMFARFGEK